MICRRHFATVRSIKSGTFVQVLLHITVSPAVTTSALYLWEWEFLARPIALLNTVQLGFGVSARHIRLDGWSHFRSARIANTALTLWAAQSTSHWELFCALHGGPTRENQADFADQTSANYCLPFFFGSLFHIISQTLPCHRSILLLFLPLTVAPQLDVKDNEKQHLKGTWRRTMAALIYGIVYHFIFMLTN